MREQKREPTVVKEPMFMTEPEPQGGKLKEGAAVNPEEKLINRIKKIY